MLSTPQLIAPPERSPLSKPFVAAPPIHPEAMNTPPAPAAPSRTLTIPFGGPVPLTATTPSVPMASPFSILAPPPPSVNPPENVSVPSPNASPRTPSVAPELACKAPVPEANLVTRPTEFLPQTVTPQTAVATPAPSQEDPKSLSLPPLPQDLRQVVAEVSILIDQTRQTLDQLFSEMVSQLNVALASPTAPVAPPQAATASNDSPKVEDVMLPPATAELVPDAKAILLENPPALPPTPAEKAEASPSLAAPVAITAAVDPIRAIELNEMLSRAFAQRQSAPPVPQTEPDSSPTIAQPQPDNFRVVARPLPRPPQTPFEMVAQLDSLTDTPVAAFPFPPLLEDPLAPIGVFGGIPPLPSPWAENEDPGHSAPFTFLSKPSEPAPQTPRPSPNWSLPPLKQTPPPPVNWHAPNGNS